MILGRLQRVRHRRRKGNILVLTALLMIVLMAVVAFAVDLGYINIARTELQRSADAAAIAATWDLVDQNALSNQAASSATLESSARTRAAQYAGLNAVLAANPGLAQEDIVVGRMSNPSDPNCQLTAYGAFAPNAVRVRVRRVADQNGEVPFFFARAMGFDKLAMQAEATAAFLSNIKGFTAPSDGSNLELLPFALDLDSWNAMLAGNASDSWTYDATTKTVTAGSDGIKELNLYPQGTGCPGNRGTVDIGSSNNSTADIARQITQGVSPSDLEHHGGSLVFDSSGKLYLNGDTGISAGVKDEMASIIGKSRIIPVFNAVSGPGNNAEYTIVMFVGIRVLDVHLTGSVSSKRVIIQPANILSRGGIVGGDTPTSQYVYSPVSLVR
jgi:Flp pilus assembly protein TadG